VSNPVEEQASGNSSIISLFSTTLFSAYINGSIGQENSTAVTKTAEEQAITTSFSLHSSLSIKSKSQDNGTVSIDQDKFTGKTNPAVDRATPSANSSPCFFLFFPFNDFFVLPTTPHLTINSSQLITPLPEEQVILADLSLKTKSRISKGIKFDKIKSAKINSKNLPNSSPFPFFQNTPNASNSTNLLKSRDKLVYLNESYSFGPFGFIELIVIAIVLIVVVVVVVLIIYFYFCRNKNTTPNELEIVHSANNHTFGIRMQKLIPGIQKKKKNDQTTATRSFGINEQQQQLQSANTARTSSHHAAFETVESPSVASASVASASVASASVASASVASASVDSASVASASVASISQTSQKYAKNLDFLPLASVKKPTMPSAPIEPNAIISHSLSFQNQQNHKIEKESTRSYSIKGSLSISSMTKFK
jgi:hypothetical protein